jgi:hypothetical protein
MALKRLVGTPQDQIEAMIVDGPHLSLFMGRRTLAEVWPKIGSWLMR